jgi:hypothetical protein
LFRLTRTDNTCGFTLYDLGLRSENRKKYLLKDSARYGEYADSPISATRDEEPMIPFESFLQLPTDEVAALVRATGQKVCVFPVNGTRRWFMLEHAEKIGDDFFEAYKNTIIQNHVELSALLFDHGIDTILSPVFGRELMHRGDEYIRRAGMDGLVRIGTRTYPEFFERQTSQSAL